MIKLLIIKYTKQKIKAENITKKSLNKNNLVSLDPKKHREPTPGPSGTTTKQQPCTTNGKQNQHILICVFCSTLPLYENIHALCDKKLKNTIYIITQ